MEKVLENAEKCDKAAVFQREIQKLTKIFEPVDEPKRQLAEGLISDAAFLAAENYSLRAALEETGMIICRPGHSEQQKAVEAARQYRQNVNSYAVIIKTLNGILSKNIIEEDDDMEEFE